MDRRYIDLSDCVYYPSKFNIDNQFKVQKGDLLIAMSGATTGKTSIYNYNRFSYLNQRVGLFRPIARNVFYPILYAYVESDNFKLSLGKLLIAGAQPNISSSDIEGIPFPVFSLAEQEKIASFLSLIDERIESCSETIKERKREKAALLNQLFSQKLRFPQFSDEWKQTTLGEVLDYEQPTNYIVRNTEYSSNVSLIPVLTANKSFILGYTYEQDAYNKGKCIILDDFTLDIKFVNFPFKVKSSAIKILVAKDGTNILFIYNCLLFLRLSEQEKDHKRHYISEIQPLIVALPSLSEQNKIADFLSLIDERIEVEEELLKQYEMQKKYLLRQMFI